MVHTLLNNTFSVLRLYTPNDVFHILCVRLNLKSICSLLKDHTRTRYVISTQDIKVNDFDHRDWPKGEGESGT